MQPQNKRGTIAQLVEQRTENPCVPGSIPGGTTKEIVTEMELSLFHSTSIFENNIIRKSENHKHILFSCAMSFYMV